MKAQRKMAVDDFGKHLVSCSDFVPHAFEELERRKAFPPGWVPEAAYRQMAEKYAALADVSVKRIVYESDGLKVTGAMVAPVDIKPGAHPVLVFNRGGNREFGLVSLPLIMGSLVPFARQGYLVFASNYRGNDGGEGKEEFGGADVHDVLKLLNLGKLHDGFDGRNAFMMGASRGGMMTCLAIKQGAAVRAAAVVAAPTDVAQSAKERPEMGPEVYAQLIPRLDSEAYRERSAVFWAEKITVPLLILHGDADDRVDVSHGKRLAEAMEAQGKPHALVVYPGGGHTLKREWDDVTARVLDWFARYRA